MPPKPSPAPVAALRGHGVAANCVSFQAPTELVSGGADGAVKLWDLRTRRERASHATAHSKAGVLHSASLGGGSTQFVTQGRDGFVRVWDAATFGPSSAPQTQFYCGSFSFTKFATLRWPDAGAGADASLDQLIVSPTGEPDQIAVFDTRSPTPALVVRVPDAANTKGMCMSLALFNAATQSGDGGTAYIAAGWEGGQLSVLDFRSGGSVVAERAIAKAASPLLSFDVTWDGATFVCGSSGEQLLRTTFDAATLTLHEPDAFFECSRGGISSVRFRSDQRIFATAGWDHRVRVFHSRKLQPLAVLKFHTESVFGLDFSPDDALLASASKDHKLALWSVYPPTEDAARRSLRAY